MGSVENLDYIDDSGNMYQGSSRGGEKKLSDMKKENSSKLNSLVIKIGTGMDSQSHVSSPGSVRDKINIDDEIGNGQIHQIQIVGTI